MPVAAVPRAHSGKPTQEKENSNDLQKEDYPFHHWYRFVLSYPPHLVRKYLEIFGVQPGETILDPFCGTGTTLVECRRHGFNSIGVEAHPHAALASRVKTRWDLDVTLLQARAKKIGHAAEAELGALALPKQSLFAEMVAEDTADYGGLTADEAKLIPEGFLSPKPLKRLLILRKHLRLVTEGLDTAYREFFYVALSHVIANGAGNFAFGPEIYRTKAKEDYDVTGHFASQVHSMIADLVHAQAVQKDWPSAKVVEGDARTLEGVDAGSIHAVITSPPYPNEKDYTRISRVESVLLGLMTDRGQLREIKERLLRSNTRNVFVNDDDGEWIADHPEVRIISEEIERRRVALGKNSGFEKLYHRVVAHYFGGMARHFSVLTKKLKRKARCAYVVGDQLSFLLVPIPTGQLLGDIARSYGFRTASIDLWRTRLGTKSGTRVREEVLVLEKL
ncbi:MAG: DNA methyltransferase [Opitutaceae bacterium]|nr:DNA methyltransferase [Opitutaceae bacterium]